MKLTINKPNVIFYSIIALILMSAFMIFQESELKQLRSESGIEKRVIKCEVPFPNKLIQNLYFVATDLQSAKEMLFNSKKGLFFDNKLYIKAADMKGIDHVIPFDLISCDSVGQQVSLSSL